MSNRAADTHQMNAGEDPPQRGPRWRANKAKVSARQTSSAGVFVRAGPRLEDMGSLRAVAGGSRVAGCYAVAVTGGEELEQDRRVSKSQSRSSVWLGGGWSGMTRLFRRTDLWSSRALGWASVLAARESGGRAGINGSGTQAQRMAWAVEVHDGVVGGGLGGSLQLTDEHRSGMHVTAASGQTTLARPLLSATAAAAGRARLVGSSGPRRLARNACHHLFMRLRLRDAAAFAGPLTGRRSVLVAVTLPVAAAPAPWG